MGADITLLVQKSDRLKVFKELEKELSKKFKVPFVAPSPGRVGKDLLAQPKSSDDDLMRVKILIKPEPGSSPKADDHETLSAYCIANAFNRGKDYSFETLSKLKNVDGIDLKTVFKKCGSDWRESSIRHGKAAYKYFPKVRGSYSFLQRGGRGKAKWIARLYNKFAILKNELGVNLNADKWDPADMWIVHDRFLKETFDDFKSLKELNSFLVKKYKDAQSGKPGIIGISLKKMEKENVKYGESNVQKFPREIRRIETFYSKVTTKFTTIRFQLVDGRGSVDNLEMAIRPFTNEESSGELKGTGSLAGKVGITEINRLFKDIIGKEIERKPELVSLFKNNQDEFYKRFYERYKGNILESNIKSAQDLRSTIELKLGAEISGYFMGKFQAVSVCKMFDDIQSEEVKNKIMIGMYAYASSTTELSGPFLKISN
jgi:hypothetical protein